MCSAMATEKLRAMDLVVHKEGLTAFFLMFSGIGVSFFGTVGQGVLGLDQRLACLLNRGKCQSKVAKGEGVCWCFHEGADDRRNHFET